MSWISSLVWSIVSGHGKTRLAPTDVQVSWPELTSGKLSREFIIDLIALIEIATVILCAVIAKSLYVDLYLHGGDPQVPYQGIGITGGLLTFFVMQQRGHYTPANLAADTRQSARIFRGLASSFLLLVMVGFLLKIANEYSRAWMVIWFGLSFVTLLVTRKLIVRWLGILASKGLFNQRVALLGVASLADAIKRQIGSEDVEIELVGDFVVDESGAGEQGIDDAVRSKLKDLVAFARDRELDRIIVALPVYGQNSVNEILLELGQITTHVDFCPGEAALHMRRPQLSYVGNLGLYNLQQAPITSWGVFIKRVFDIVVAALALLVAGIPMLLIAAVVRLTSKGNALFIQDRHGLNGRIIPVMKFRSMTDRDRSQTAHQVKKGDMEITPVGRVLRKTSLDELPQLLNVLKGDMSIVGPRPHPIKLDEQFSDMVQLNKQYQRLDYYMARYKVKPGITGWAQVNGLRGETDKYEKMEKRVEYDLDYINNWSIWLDIKIVLLTFAAIIKGENAH